MGAMCARVCPTENLCEGACVRETSESRAVEIGRLQRYATDAAFASGRQFYRAGPPSGRRVAVVGAGPAGLSCAHALARAGHQVTVFEARPKGGGLNEYGIAAYKTNDDIAQKEIAYILDVGGIEIEFGKALGRDFTVASLRAGFDAVFLGIGLGDTNALGLGAVPEGVMDAVDFIATLRQAPDKTTVPVGRNVLVIGGGMTAIDAATQAKLLGAECVTIAYRRAKTEMPASPYEQDVAQVRGVLIRENLMPVALESRNGTVSGVTFEHTRSEGGELVGTGERITLAGRPGTDRDRPVAENGRPLRHRTGVRERPRRGRWRAPYQHPGHMGRRRLYRRWQRFDGASPSPTARRPRRRSSPPCRPQRPPFAQERKPWRTFAPPSPASDRRTRSGSPRRRRPTRRTTSFAPSRRAGAAWSGRPSAKTRRSSMSASRYGAIHGADRRVIGFNNIELITDRPLDVNLREITQVKRDWPDRALVVSLMVPCEEANWQRDHRSASRTPAPTASSSISAVRTA